MFSGCSGNSHLPTPTGEHREEEQKSSLPELSHRIARLPFCPSPLAIHPTVGARSTRSLCLETLSSVLLGGLQVLREGDRIPSPGSLVAHGSHLWLLPTDQGLSLSEHGAILTTSYGER